MQPFATLHGPALQRAINASQFDRARSAGFYESYFLRGNHPTRPQAFWIRYTLFSPKDDVARTEGQLWAVYFDGESGTRVAVKQRAPLNDCVFSPEELQVRIGESVLDANRVTGTARDARHHLSWQLGYQGAASPAFLLPVGLYAGGFPKAKVLTAVPLADFEGQISLDGHMVDVTAWRGSQNHNWGPKHTDQYAWGQVAGFDAEPDAFLECSTARLKIGPFWTPWLTNVVLRRRGREIRLNSLGQALRNRGRYGYFQWTIECTRGPLQVTINFTAPPDRFVALGYDDPPGGQRTCLNTKIATCVVRVTEHGQPPIELTTASRAAFEILAVDGAHGIPMSA